MLCSGAMEFSVCLCFLCVFCGDLWVLDGVSYEPWLLRCGHFPAGVVGVWMWIWVEDVYSETGVLVGNVYDACVHVADAGSCRSCVLGGVERKVQMVQTGSLIWVFTFGISLFLIYMIIHIFEVEV